MRDLEDQELLELNNNNDYSSRHRDLQIQLRLNSMAENQFLNTHPTTPRDSMNSPRMPNLP